MTTAPAFDVPITRPSLDQSETDAVAAVLASGMLVQGARIAEFEASVRAVVGTEHAVAVSNCTVALELILRAMGVGPGSLVLVTPYSWVTTVNVIEMVGAKPVFVDIDPVHCNMAPRALEATLDRLRAAGLLRSVAAILPVYTFGNLSGIEAIAALAADAGIPVIEDAACAIGGEAGGRSAGAIGLAGAFSFHPRKVVTTGEGGVVTTDDDAIASWIRAYRNHGQDSGQFVAVGSNLRMTEMQGAMGVVQMGKLAELCKERARLAENYDRVLPDLGVRPQQRSAGAIVQSYVCMVPEQRKAADVVAELRARRVEATIGTVAIPFTPHHRERYGVTDASLPGLAEVWGRAITLPLFPGMTESQQELVVSTLAAVLG